MFPKVNKLDNFLEHPIEPMDFVRLWLETYNRKYFSQEIWQEITTTHGFAKFCDGLLARNLGVLPNAVERMGNPSDRYCKMSEKHKFRLAHIAFTIKSKRAPLAPAPRSLCGNQNATR